MSRCVGGGSGVVMICLCTARSSPRMCLWMRASTLVRDAPSTWVMNEVHNASYTLRCAFWYAFPRAMDRARHRVRRLQTVHHTNIILTILNTTNCITCNEPSFQRHRCWVSAVWWWRRRQRHCARVQHWHWLHSGSAGSAQPAPVRLAAHQRTVQ